MATRRIVVSGRGGTARGVRERRFEEGKKRLVIIAVTARRGSTVVNQKEYKGWMIDAMLRCRTVCGETQDRYKIISNTCWKWCLRL